MSKAKEFQKLFKNSQNRINSSQNQQNIPRMSASDSGMVPVNLLLKRSISTQSKPSNIVSIQGKSDIVVWNSTFRTNLPIRFRFVHRPSDSGMGPTN